MELDIWIQTDGTQYVDVAQCASLINRKMVRQGFRYFIQDVTLFADPGAIGGGAANTCIIERLPDGWVAVNAWTKSMKVWERSEEQVLALQPELKAKWRDFKIFMDAAHANQSHQLQGNACPVGFGDWDLTSPTLGTLGYDWVASEIVIPNDPASTSPEGDEAYFLHMVGSNNGVKSKSMIQGYATSRARPMSPDPNKVANTGWMVEAFDDGDNLAQIEGNVRAHNDEPPYYLEENAGSGSEYYPGGSSGMGGLAVVADLAATQYQTQKSSGSFMANCGLLKLTSTGSGLLRIRLAPGPYKGLMALPMQDVN
jgi:hypothetical protein